MAFIVGVVVLAAWIILPTVFVAALAYAMFFRSKPRPPRSSFESTGPTTL